MSSSRRARWSNSSGSVPELFRPEHLPVTHLMKRKFGEARVGALGAVGRIAEALVEKPGRHVRLQDPQRDGRARALSRIVESLRAKRAAGAVAPRIRSHIDGEDLGDAILLVARRAVEAEAGDR